MPVKPIPLRLGDLQLRILQELWSRGGATVGEVHEAIRLERVLAYTTIATMLRKMEARGLVAHVEEGRTFRYSASVQAEQVGRSMTDRVVEQLFEGSLAGTVSHLLQTRDVTRAELEQLAQLIRAAKRKVK